MTCQRCQGLLVQDDSFDLRESERRFAVWRCVLCGEMLDPVIAANRRRHLSGTEWPKHPAGSGIPQPSLARAA